MLASQAIRADQLIDRMAKLLLLLRGNQVQELEIDATRLRADGSLIQASFRDAIAPGSPRCAVGDTSMLD